MSDFLFSEFDLVSAKQWKQKIQADLKGADYNETLLWKTDEGITVKPFYHLDNVEQLNFTPTKDSFAICQSIFISDEKTANLIAKGILNRGVNAIQFEANEPFDIDILLHGLTLDEVKESFSIHFKLNFLSENFLIELIERNLSNISFLNIDLIGNLARTGNWYYSQKEDHQILDRIFSNTIKNGAVLSVDASLYQNAGATSVQQVAYALAHANEYLNHFNNSNEPVVKRYAGRIKFDFSVGSNYFFEMAKLRAFRYLWDLVCDEYGYTIEPHIFVTPSLRNKTLYDYNVNMLRTTTECMSAILGGANTISNIAYDHIYHKKNEFGERISRNQLLVLQNESYFKEAAHFADGSYYIETLTKQIAEKALAIFKDIEKSGGFLKQLVEDTIQRKIKESAEKEQAQFDSGEKVLLGTNKHPNQSDRMKEVIKLYPFVKTKPRKTAITPIIPKRLAEKLEQGRLENE